MSVVDDVKARLDIVEVVSGYITLQKAGRNYKALCPFHQEKTPSFVVFPDTQTWRCFGACGEGGDVFGFVMKREGWDFVETLRELALRAGVELQPYTPEQTERQAESERLRGLLEETARFFHEQLRDAPTAQIARDYVIGRGLTEDTVDTFMLGYGPNDWRQALDHLRLRGYSQDEIVEAGVAIRSDEGHVYDRFRHRLVIPIRDGRGNTAGFGARALDKDAVPKYLNSPQGPLFDKSRLLFGLDMARRAIRETETVIVVEGYMDVMQAHQAGFVNVVAQMGTALTEEQLRQLDRYANRLILALDPDVAGVNATMRGLNVASQTLDEGETLAFDARGMMRYTDVLNIGIRVVSLPEGKDPDDLIRENRDAWIALIERSVPLVDFVVKQATRSLSENASYNEREAIAIELLPLLTATENDALALKNVQTLARHIRLDDKALMIWAHGIKLRNVRAHPTIKRQRELVERSILKTKVSSSPPGQSEVRESFCLQLLIAQPERLYAANRKLRELQNEAAILSNLLDPLSGEDFTRADYKVVFEALERSLYEEDSNPIEFLHRALPPELGSIVDDLRDASLKRLRNGVPRSLTTDFESIRRDQTRINALPEPDTALFVQETLTLRQSRIDRELRELYFLQQDINDWTGQRYQDALRAHTRARQLLALALREMRSLARDT